MTSFSPSFQAEVDNWKNENAYNELLHARFTILVNEDPVLKAHRDWVEANQFGFGDRPFHWLWKLLIEQMPQDFSFLEIGVFKGQVTSLVSLLAKNSGTGKSAQVYGVTTLENTPDARCKYPYGDYVKWIGQIHRQFQVHIPRLIIGKSNEPEVIESVNEAGDFDIVYVDGSHDYQRVVEDIANYAPKVKVGGFLVMDDASINRLHIGILWPGLEEVGQAVKDHLDNDPRFKFLLCCGHINVFERVK